MAPSLPSIFLATENAYKQEPVYSWTQIGFTSVVGFGFMVIIGLTIFPLVCFFSWFRRTKTGQLWLTPKRHVRPHLTPNDLTKDTLFGWIKELWLMKDEHILMYAGYDVLIFIKILRMGFWSIAYFMPYAFAVILPVNLAQSPSHAEGSTVGYFRTTIQHIPVRDHNRLTAHVVGICLLQIIIMVLAFNTQLEYVQLRRAFLKQKARKTVLVTGIPPRLRSNVLIQHYFDSCYSLGGASDGVTSVQFVKNLQELEKLISQREETLKKLERLLVIHWKRTHRSIESESRQATDGSNQSPSSSVRRIDSDGKSVVGKLFGAVISQTPSEAHEPDPVEFENSGDVDDDTRGDLARVRSSITLDSPKTIAARMGGHDAVAETFEELIAQFDEWCAEHSLKEEDYYNDVLSKHYTSRSIRTVPHLVLQRGWNCFKSIQGPTKKELRSRIEALRAQLSEENLLVCKQQKSYARIHKSTERRMTLKADKILATEFDVEPNHVSLLSARRGSSYYSSQSAPESARSDPSRRSSVETIHNVLKLGGGRESRQSSISSSGYTVDEPLSEMLKSPARDSLTGAVGIATRSSHSSGGTPSRRGVNWQDEDTSAHYTGHVNLPTVMSVDHDEQMEDEAIDPAVDAPLNLPTAESSQDGVDMNKFKRNTVELEPINSAPNTSEGHVTDMMGSKVPPLRFSGDAYTRASSIFSTLGPTPLEFDDDSDQEEEADTLNGCYLVDVNLRFEFRSVRIQLSQDQNRVIDLKRAIEELEGIAVEDQIVHLPPSASSPVRRPRPASFDSAATNGARKRFTLGSSASTPTRGALESVMMELPSSTDESAQGRRCLRLVGRALRCCGLHKTEGPSNVKVLAEHRRQLESYGFQPGVPKEVYLVVVSQSPLVLSSGQVPSTSMRQRLSVKLHRVESKNQSEEESDEQLFDLKSQHIQREWLPLTGSVFDYFDQRVSIEKLKPGANSDKAFVTFSSVTLATMASQILHSINGHVQAMQVVEAPDPLDLFWPNINRTVISRRALHLCVESLVAMLIIFFVVPITYLNQLLGSQQIEKYTEDWPWVFNQMKGFILPGILVIVSNLLPPLLTGLGFFEGTMTWSENGLLQLDRMFGFLLVNVFLVSILSGTIVNSLVDIVSAPQRTAVYVATSLPQLSGFFCQYLMLKAFLSLSVELVRGLTFFHMVCRFLFRLNDATRREREAVVAGIRRYDNPGWIPFGKHFAHILVAMLMIYSFACMAPLILLPGLLYFGCAQLVYRYTLLYVYEPRFESGGRFWPGVLKWLIRIMYLSQGLMLCMFLLRAYYLGFFLVCCLLFLTYSFQRIIVCEDSELLQIPLEVAVHLDQPNQRRQSTAQVPVFLAHLCGQSTPGEKGEWSNSFKHLLQRVYGSEASEFIQPALVSPAIAKPQHPRSLESPSLWSSDPHHRRSCPSCVPWASLRRLFAALCRWICCLRPPPLPITPNENDPPLVSTHIGQAGRDVEI